MKGEKIVKVSLNAGVGYQARVSQAQGVSNAPSFKCNAEASRELARAVWAELLKGKGKNTPLEQVVRTVYAVANRTLSRIEKRGIRAIIENRSQKSLVVKIDAAAQIASGQATAHLRPSVATAKTASSAATASVEPKQAIALVG